MKPLWINRDGTITEGFLKGLIGKVVAFDSEKDEAVLEIDRVSKVIISSEYINQD